MQDGAPQATDRERGDELAELARALTPDPEELGLRERKKRARRGVLIDAAQDLVERHGLDAVTVEQVCEAAGVSTRTFFNYFDSKDDAVLGHVAWPVDSGPAHLFAQGGPSGELVDDLVVLLADLFESPPVGRDRVERGFALARREPRLLAKHMGWVEEHRDQLVDLLRRRLGDPPEHPVEVVTALTMVLVHAAVQDAAGGDAAPAERDGRARLTEVVTALRRLLDAA